MRCWSRKSIRAARRSGRGNHDLARHWEKSLAEAAADLRAWPAILAERGAIDLAERRNRLLDALADRWKDEPPPGFTVAAGITTAAPAVAALVARVARMPEGMVVLPGLWLSEIFPDEEWDALGPDENRARRGQPSAIPPEAASRPASAWRAARCSRGAGPDGAASSPREAGRSPMPWLRPISRTNGRRCGRRPAPERAFASRSWPIQPPKRRRSRWRCARRSKRRARRPRLSRPIASWQVACRRCSPLGHPGRRQRGQAALDRLRRALCSSALRRPPRRSWRRRRCSRCSSIRWSAARATSGCSGWSMCVHSTGVARTAPAAGTCGPGRAICARRTRMRAWSAVRDRIAGLGGMLREPVSLARLAGECRRSGNGAGW